MQSLFNQDTQDEIFNRINNLNESSQPNWGKMTVDQMFKHCQLPLEVANGKLELDTNIGFFKKLIFKAFKPFMYNDKPWKKNLDTPRQFRVTDKQVFVTEKEKLKTVISDFASRKNETNWPPHPLFGKFSTEQWGKMQYKHLDHHLTQFGV